MSIFKFYSIITCLIALYLRLQGGLCLCWEHSHVNLLVLLNHDMSWVPCACDCKVVFVFAGCIAMSVCKFYSITTWFECPVPAIARRSVSLLGAQSCQFISSTRSWHVLSALSLRLQGVCVFAWYTVMSICKFYSIMTCLSALCLQLQGDLCHCWVHSHVNLLSSTQSWHVWVPCACYCKIVCVFAGSTVMSICKFSSIMKCLACPVPAIARWSVSLLAAQSCQFLSSWVPLSALSLWLQGCLCLCWVHSHVNLQVLLNHDMPWVPCACDCKVVCVFAGCTAMSICKFYSIMTCLECPVPARLSVSLLGAQPCQFASSTQSWHVWVPCACDCKVVCVFAGSTVMSICKFYSIMTCLTALCLRLQGGLCLYWEHSHVNL